MRPQRIAAEYKLAPKPFMRPAAASMRPQRIAAEYPVREGFQIGVLIGFNEAAANRCGIPVRAGLVAGAGEGVLQ